MRIACASCNAAYDVPPERVPPGKGVKCARCGTVWIPVERIDAGPVITPTPAADVVTWPETAARETPELDVPVPVGNGDEPDNAGPAALVPLVAARPAAALRNGAVLIGWALSILLLAGIGWAAVQHRATIVQAWPSAARAYALIGLR